MAEITNGAQYASTRKKIYGTKSFDDLYAYAAPITLLREYSSKIFSQYISEGINGLNANIDDAVLEFEHGMVNACPSHAGYVELDIRHDRDPDNDEAPSHLRFTVLKIMNGVSEFDDAEARALTALLDEAIGIGLYPVIDVPTSAQAIMDSVEKYDTVIRAGGMGIVVGYKSVGRRIYALVMLNPEFSNDIAAECWAAFSGTIRVVDGLLTPEAWRDATDAISIPAFEFTPYRAVMAHMMESVRLRETINSGLVNGLYTLDFVDSIIAKMMESTQIAATIVDDVDDTNYVDTEDVPIIVHTSDDMAHVENCYDPYAVIRESIISPDDDDICDTLSDGLVDVIHHFSA